MGGETKTLGIHGFLLFRNTRCYQNTDSLILFRGHKTTRKESIKYSNVKV